MKNTDCVFLLIIIIFVNSGYEIEYSLGTNENKRFFQVHTTEFGLDAGA